jgi:hypothetical protein
MAALMGLTVEEAEIMLQKYNWNKEKLMDAFFNNVNVKKESGLEHYSPTACSITEKFHLGCDHIYCRECYGGYIRHKVLNELSCTPIKMSRTNLYVSCSTILYKAFLALWEIFNCQFSEYLQKCTSM